MLAFCEKSDIEIENPLITDNTKCCSLCYFILCFTGSSGIIIKEKICGTICRSQAEKILVSPYGWCSLQKNNFLFL